MAIKPWVTILTTDKDGESVVNENLVKLFHDNQEALITGPVDCRFDQLDETTGTPDTSTEEVFIPEACKTTDGDCELVVRFEKQVTGGATGQVRITLGSGTPVLLGTFTNATWDTVEIRISAADVLSGAGGISNLLIEVWITSGSGTASVRNTFSSSRIERIA